MKKLQSFMTIASKINNNPDTIAEYGELSVYGRTFARDVLDYISADGLGLTVFEYKDNTIDQELSAQEVNRIKEVFTIITANLEIATDVVNTQPIKDNVVAETGDVRGIIFGDITPTPFRTNYIRFILNINGSETDVNIYTSDAKLREIYPTGLILSVPPVADIKTLRNPANIDTLKLLTDTIDPVEINQRLNTIRGDIPESELAILPIDISPVDGIGAITLHWRFLVYGPNLAQEDLLKNKVIDDIRTIDPTKLELWANVIAPDLFDQTTFFIYPQYDPKAITDLGEQEGVYSPTMNPNEVSLSIAATTSLSTQHVLETMETTHFPYKDIAIASVPNVTNEEVLSIKGIYPDYVSYSHGSPEFFRMSENTREWAIFMLKMIAIAEGNYLVDPTLDTRRSEIDGLAYATGTFDSITWHVKLRE